MSPPSTVLSVLLPPTNGKLVVSRLGAGHEQDQPGHPVTLVGKKMLKKRMGHANIQEHKSQLERPTQDL